MNVTTSRSGTPPPSLVANPIICADDSDLLKAA